MPFRGWPAVLVVACSVHGATAHADDNATQRAQELFEQARGEMKQSEYARAYEHLVDSLRFEKSAGTLINLAICEEKLDKLGDSLGHLRDAMELAEPDERRRALVTKLVAALEPRVPILVLQWEGEAGPTEATLDGEPVDLASGQRGLRVNPGDHVLVARSADGQRRQFLAHLGEHETITIDARTPPVPPLAPPPREEPIDVAVPSPSKATAQVGAIGLGVGGLAVITGSVTGFMALGRKVTVDHHCDTNGCDAEGRDASQEGKALATTSTISSVTGLVGMGVGTYLLFRAAEPIASEGPDPYRSVGYGAAAIGAIGLLTSAITARGAVWAERERQDHCSVDHRCDQAGTDAASRGQAYSIVSTVAFGIGLAGAVGASYSLLFRPLFKKAPDSWLNLSPTGITCTTMF